MVLATPPHASSSGMRAQASQQRGLAPWGRKATAAGAPERLWLSGCILQVVQGLARGQVAAPLEQNFLHRVQPFGGALQRPTAGQRRQLA